MQINKDEITEIYILKCQHILKKQEPENSQKTEEKTSAPSIDAEKVRINLI